MNLSKGTLKSIAIAGICIFSAVILLTAYNLIFQTGVNADSAGFPATIFKSLKIDLFTKYGLIAFCGLALCFFILGYPRSK
jgi:hypothetical protein